VLSAADCDMLQQVWVEADYQLEVCRVTKGRHTYHFWGMKKKTWWISLPSVGHMLQYFLAFKHTDFMKSCGIMTCNANWVTVAGTEMQIFLVACTVT
jgi:hypothetical protein